MKVDTPFLESLPFGIVSLPYRGDYLLYSAYNKKFARIPNTNLDLDSAKVELEEEGFFAIPAKQTDHTSRVTLIVTTDCNLRCGYCYAKAGEHSQYMPLWLARRAIEFAVQPETEELFISFFGGEPTLNFEVIKAVIRDIELLNLPFTPIISTNGVVSNDVLQFLIKKKFIIKLSIDGPPDIQDRYRVFADGRPTSQIVESTLRTLVREGVQPRVRVTLTKETLCRVKEIIEYLTSLGVSIVHMELVAQRGRAGEQNFERPTPDIYVDTIISAIRHCEEKGIQFISSSLLRLFAPATHYCTSLAGRKLVFTPDGLITSCLETQNCLNAPPEFVMGKYVPEKGTYDYDLSKTVPDIRKIMPKCEKCSLISVCCGGCPIRNFSTTGKITDIDAWQCEVRKKLICKILVQMYNESQQIKERAIEF